jgi:Raf kinase inhibitor-like YbhB/YbcL family protein
MTADAVFQHKSLILTSSDFKDNASLPLRFGLHNDNINPSLSISSVPKEAESLVLIMHDPDAPVGDWLHWLVWNIPPETKEIPIGALPVGAIEGTTSWGKTGYGGPAPPKGTHRYMFDLFALDCSCDAKYGEKLEAIRNKMDGHVLDFVRLTGTYSA